MQVEPVELEGRRELAASVVSVTGWKWIVLSLGALVLVIGAVVVGIQIGKKREVGTEFSPTPTIAAVTETSSPTPSDQSPEPTETASQTYPVPQGWLEYSDKEAGITINYPPQFTAKYNPNRGFGVNYAAGSYLLGTKGEKILDFYKFAYKGGSRRESFYDEVEFDGPEDMSKYTVAADDVVLNGRRFLKLVSGYWQKSGGGESRVFYLAAQGGFVYYFTYSQGVEKNQDEITNVLTVIANSSFAASEAGSQDLPAVYCYPRPDVGNRGSYWEASIDGGGNIIVVQRSDKALKQQVVYKSRVEIAANFQKMPYETFSIMDFEMNIDSTKKGGYQDAFVIKIKKADVDRIKAGTPSSIPSVAVIVSINGGVETGGGEICKSHLYGYFAPR